MEYTYWGEEYGEEAIVSSLREQGIRVEQYHDDERLLERVVDGLIPA
jgi:hypothetical protein